MYVIAEVQGQQFKVEAGRRLFVHHISGAEAGAVVEFDKVMLVDKDGEVTVGVPTVAGAKVVCEVLTPLVKGDKVLSRYQDILLEASEQCKRNLIPEIVEPVKIADLKDYCSEKNLLPYENAYGGAKYIGEVLDKKESITIAIGPEGGFSDDEVEMLKGMGFETVTLGPRILRAETAAMYACSVAGEVLARK